MANVVWFDGLGSALIGGVVAAAVALFVTRAQLNHDRRMRAASAREDVLLAFAVTLAELRAARSPAGYIQREVEVVRRLFLRLRTELEAVVRTAPAKDPEFRGWLQEFRSELDAELASNQYRRDTNDAAVVWVLRMGEQVEPRFMDRSAPLERLERPDLQPRSK